MERGSFYEAKSESCSVCVKLSVNQTACSEKIGCQNKVVMLGVGRTKQLSNTSQ